MKYPLRLVLAIAAMATPMVAVAETAATPFMPVEALSYCVPVLDFQAEQPRCVDESRLPSVIYNGKVVAPVPLPASSFYLVRDPISAGWTMYTETDQ